PLSPPSHSSEDSTSRVARNPHASSASSSNLLILQACDVVGGRARGARPVIAERRPGTGTRTRFGRSERSAGLATYGSGPPELQRCARLRAVSRLPGTNVMLFIVQFEDHPGVDELRSEEHTSELQSREK